MDKVVRSVKCAWYSFRKLLTKPKGLAIVFVVYLYMESVIEPIRGFLMAHDVSINGFGLYVFLLSDSMFVVVAGIGLMMLLGDAPFFDDAQNYVMIRGGRAQWVNGQILYIMGVTTIYLLVLMLLAHVLLFPYVQYGNQWGKALRTLSETSMAGQCGIGLSFSEKIVHQWSPRRAFALEMTLRFVAYVSCALMMFSINLAFRNKLGIVAALFTLLLDLFVETSLAYVYFILSISSLARLSIMDFGYDPYYVDVGPSMMVLIGSFALLIILSSVLGRRCDLARAAQDN